MSAAKTTLGWGFLLVAAASGCERAHLRLVNEGDPGPLYRCDGVVCEPAQTDDPSRKNRGGTDFYVLPEGCVELKSAWLLPAGPAVDVECGPPGSSTSYRCEARACRPLGLFERDDGASALAIHLPSDCGGRIHELVVLDAQERAPKVYVECDASSGPPGDVGR